MRYSRENPWEGLDLWRRLMPHTPLRGGQQPDRQVRESPDAILDLWGQTLIRHGTNSFRVYDCLYDLDQIHPRRRRRGAGRHPPRARRG